jgi:hypothetical protein
MTPEQLNVYLAFLLTASCLVSAMNFYLTWMR